MNQDNLGGDILTNKDYDKLNDDEIGTTIDNIMGHVYIQKDTLGLASYHFNHPKDNAEGEAGSYISYEKVPSSMVLDNGNPLPSKKYFS